MDRFNLDAWLATPSDTVFTPTQLMSNLVARCHEFYEQQHLKVLYRLHGVRDNPLEVKLILDSEMKRSSDAVNTPQS